MNKDAEMQMLSSQGQMIAEQIEKIDSALMELEYIKLNFDELKNTKEGTEILCPASSGIFLKAKIDKTSKLLVNVGNGVVVEKTIEQVKELLDDRINEMGESREHLLGQMEKIEERLRTLSEE